MCNWENFLKTNKTPYNNSLRLFLLCLVYRESKIELNSWLLGHAMSAMHKKTPIVAIWLLTKLWNQGEKLLCLTPCPSTGDDSNNSGGGFTFWLMAAGSVRCWFLLKSVWLSSCNLHNFFMRMLIEYHGNSDHEVDQNSNCKRTQKKVAIVHRIHPASVQIARLDHAMEKQKQRDAEAVYKGQNP